MESELRGECRRGPGSAAGISGPRTIPERLVLAVSSMYQVVTTAVCLSHRKPIMVYLPSCSTLTVPPSAELSQSPSVFHKANLSLWALQMDRPVAVYKVSCAILT
jgi:hypothetical protein